MSFFFDITLGLVHVFQKYYPRVHDFMPLMTSLLFGSPQLSLLVTFALLSELESSIFLL